MMDRANTRTAMFQYTSVDQPVPADDPLGVIEAVVDWQVIREGLAPHLQWDDETPDAGSIPAADQPEIAGAGGQVELAAQPLAEYPLGLDPAPQEVVVGHALGGVVE